MLDEAQSIAEAKLGPEVTDAVVTVPSFYGQTQRQPVVQAGLIAGLIVVRLINESTAVALAYAYALKDDRKRERTVLVIDVGASKTDLCLARVKKGAVTVLASAGNELCCGDEFTQRLVDYITNYIAARYEEDVRGSAQTIKRIAEACEKAKHSLSDASGCW